MPRPQKSVSIQSIIENSAGDVVLRAAESISRAVAQLVAEQLEKQLSGSPGARRTRNGAGRTSRSRRGGELTTWVADRRARRVPTFVIEMTGLDTKKKVVEKYGENATFARGKPLPKTAKAA